MKIVIIGGGASGMLASSMISKNNKVILVEKNEKLGKKLYITEKTHDNRQGQMQRHKRLRPA